MKESCEKLHEVNESVIQFNLLPTNINTEFLKEKERERKKKEEKKRSLKMAKLIYAR